MITNKLSLWLYVSTVFVISNKLITNSPFNYFNGNKLLFILLCYFVTVGDFETPKSKGRPKKASKSFKGFKPKKLDFSSVVDNDSTVKISNQDLKKKISVVEN